MTWQGFRLWYSWVTTQEGISYDYQPAEGLYKSKHDVSMAAYQLAADKPTMMRAWTVDKSRSVTPLYHNDEMTEWLERPKVFLWHDHPRKIWVYKSYKIFHLVWAFYNMPPDYTYIKGKVIRVSDHNYMVYVPTANQPVALCKPMIFVEVEVKSRAKLQSILEKYNVTKDRLRFVD
jgi:hypothetical protein